jgi:hypothetical protein
MAIQRTRPYQPGMADYAQQSGNPFWNPYSKYPDVGQGIRSVLNQLWLRKVLRQQEQKTQEEAQRQYELEERRTKAAEKQAEAAYTRATTPSPEELARRNRDAFGRFMIKSGKWTTEKAWKFSETKQWPDEPITLSPGERKLVSNKLGISEEDIDKLDEGTKKLARHIFQSVATTQPKTLEEIRAEAEARAKGAGTGKYATPTPPREPTIASGAPARASNGATISTLLNPKTGTVPSGDAAIKKAREYIKEGLEPRMENGYQLDMPAEYNLAMMNLRDEVATPEDEELILEYNTMKAVFMNMILPEYQETRRAETTNIFTPISKLLSRKRGGFQYFLNSQYAKEAGLDKNFIKRLFDIYGD